ncbi:hypothetical protein [Bacillus sp. FJAT-28004]|uniref:hypothetical protein n=1 Tax=Bacillus sp. FJAT-28004 TaxID=1679165 RepID=UPI0006B46A3C|nr:hypothetical protein [Bacillus sp. FJAT-28004]
MKKVLSMFIGLTMIISLFGCANSDSVKSSTPMIDKEYVEKKAQIGLSISEIKKMFGDQYASGAADGGEIWMYDTVNEGFEYKPRLDAVAHEEIKNGDVKYQLFINIIQEKAYMYSYFYKGEDEKVWEYVLNPDKTILEIPVSN